MHRISFYVNVYLHMNNSICSSTLISFIKNVFTSSFCMFPVCSMKGTRCAAQCCTRTNFLDSLFHIKDLEEIPAGLEYGLSLKTKLWYVVQPTGLFLIALIHYHPVPPLDMWPYNCFVSLCATSFALLPEKEYVYMYMYMWICCISGFIMHKQIGSQIFAYL